MGLAPYVGDSKKAGEQAKLFADLFEFDPKNPLVWRRRKGIAVHVQRLRVSPQTSLSPAF